MRKIYQSQAKEYKIPKERVDELLVDLEGAIKTESNRVRAFAGMEIRTQDVLTPRGYRIGSLRRAREGGKYTGVKSLARSEVVVWSEAVPFENGRFQFGGLTPINYATLRLEDNIAKVVMTEKEGLASNPSVVEKVLIQYVK